MRILILTSKDHIYANFACKALMESGILNPHEIMVCEQDWIIPHKTAYQGLRKYLQIAGWRYVFVQAIKQYLFHIVRCLNRLLKRRTSPFFPYYKISHPSFSRQKLQDMRSKQTIDQIQNFQPDLILSILSKEVLPKAIITLPRYGCVNLHPALLPHYRGVSPIFWALANRERAVGCTLHYIDNRIDTGSIIAQTPLHVEDTRSEHALYLQCVKVGIPLLVQFIQNVQNDEAPESIPQTKKGSYYSLPTKEAVKRFYQAGYTFFRLREFFT